MSLTLNKGPLYIQVQEKIKKRIITGDYPIGSLIPPEPELKKEYKVSIITVRRAVEELVMQGYLEKRSGIGTTVLDNKAISNLSKGQGFSEYLSGKGLDLKKEFISLKTVDTTKDSVLKRYFDGSCYCVERLYLLDNQPYIHFKHYISREIEIPESEIKFEESLYEIMYEQGFVFKRFKDEFGVGVPEAEIARILKIEEKPTLNRIRYSYDMSDKILEYSVGYYNTDIQKYVVNFDL